MRCQDNLHQTTCCPQVAPADMELYEAVGLRSRLWQALSCIAAALRLVRGMGCNFHPYEGPAEQRLTDGRPVLLVYPVGGTVVLCLYHCPWWPVVESAFAGSLMG